MVRKTPLEEPARNRRPVTGGIVLACLVAVGLTIFLIIGADYDKERADLDSTVPVLVFNSLLLVQHDDVGPDVFLFFVAAALISFASAFCAITRREWTVAWVGSLFGLAFGLSRWWGYISSAHRICTSRVTLF
jgi:hypothetical protein